MSNWWIAAAVVAYYGVVLHLGMKIIDRELNDVQD